MRELGFTQMWPKLKQNIFTTVRFQRKDVDWKEGEVVKVVYKPRSKERKILGVAKIVSKEPRDISGWHSGAVMPTLHKSLTVAEAIEDGFSTRAEMYKWLLKAHGRRGVYSNQINKLTLIWI